MTTDPLTVEPLAAVGVHRLAKAVWEVTVAGVAEMAAAAAGVAIKPLKIK
jgi:hypothetical protein